MGILKIALEKDLDQDFTLDRFNTSWQNETPIILPSDYPDIASVKELTGNYAALMNSLGQPDLIVLKSVTYSKACLDSLPIESKGIRIYLGLRQGTLNGNSVREIFPILVPVGSTYEDLIEDSPSKAFFMIDGESKCPPPDGVCHKEKLKLLPD